MGLTVGQAIGIGIAVGIVVGFVGALVLVHCSPTTSPDRAVDPTTATARAVENGESLSPTRDGLSHKIENGEPVEAIQRPSQEVEEVANPKSDSLRLFDRMRPLATVPQLAEVIEFEYWINSFARTCIKTPYRPQPLVPESLFDENELVRLAGNPINGGTWSASISNKATRASAVKCFLAQFIFKRMHPTCPPQDTLLPPEIASCYQFICLPTDNSRREDWTAIWRETMYLLLEDPLDLHPVPPRWFEEGDPREERTLAMVPVLIDALRLESLRTDLEPDDKIEKSLAGILEQSANSALHLLAQPSEWEAVWVTNEPGFIIFPEIRLVWNGYTKFSKPVVVEIPSDDNRRAGDNQQTDDKQHPDVDASEQPKPDTEKLPSLEDGQSLTPEAGHEPGPGTANQ